LLVLNVIVLLHSLASASCTDPKTCTATIPTKPSATTNAYIAAEANTLTWIILEKKVIVSSYYYFMHLPLLAFTATLVLHPLASASCIVSMMSTATTLTSPNAATRANTIIIEQFTV
jgi:hypothetical protein